MVNKGINLKYASNNYIIEDRYCHNAENCNFYFERLKLSANVNRNTMQF
jgi:hypothetical protein